MKQVKTWILCGFLGVALAVMLTATASAADLQKGIDAYNAGDYATAFAEFNSLAEAGDAEAQFILGGMYTEGRGVPQDYEEAVKWTRLAAEAGHRSAQINLGLMYRYGKGVAQNYAEAVKWFRPAAEAGDANAQYNLGNTYWKGAPHDLRSAYMWLNLAVAQGHTTATESRDEVAILMSSTQLSEAQKFSRQCFAQKYKDCFTAPLADFETAARFQNAGDYATALTILFALAESGDIESQRYLGLMYLAGFGGVVEDAVEAVKWYRLAAEAGDASSQLSLGSRYALGDGVVQNHAEAAKWYHRGIETYRLAAEAGDAGAQYNLGWVYENGRGVTKDNHLAYMWYDLATAQGNKTAKENRNKVASDMTPTQIAEAKRMAQKCLAQNYKGC